MREVIVSHCLVLMRFHMEYCIQVLGSQYKKVVELLEQVQSRATKIIRGLKHLVYKESTGLVHPEKQKVRGRPA